MLRQSLHCRATADRCPPRGRNSTRQKPMKPPDSRHQDTMAIAGAALAQMTTHGQPADPRSYALWYNFAAGDSGLLCAAVNGRLERGGKLSSKDIDKLHNAHICSNRRIREGRQGGRPHRRRDRANHDDARGGGRFGLELLGEPRQTSRAARDGEGPRGRARHRREPGRRHQGDGNAPISSCKTRCKRCGKRSRISAGNWRPFARKASPTR